MNFSATIESSEVKYAEDWYGKKLPSDFMKLMKDLGGKYYGGKLEDPLSETIHAAILCLKKRDMHSVRGWIDTFKEMMDDFPNKKEFPEVWCLEHAVPVAMDCGGNIVTLKDGKVYFWGHDTGEPMWKIANSITEWRRKLKERK